ncbi:hypothetical protein ACJJTC_015453 [Scirpophaga incertulas]
MAARLGDLLPARVACRSVELMSPAKRLQGKNKITVIKKTVVDNIGLCDFLASVDWYPVTTKSDVNESVGAFLGIMGNAIELNSRKVRISRSKYIIRPWMTPGLLRCSRHKDKLHAKSKQNPINEVINISYRRYRNFYTDIVRKVRLTYERELLQRNSKNTKLLWKSTKDICYTKTSHPVSEKLLTITNDPKVSLNKCNDFFSSVGLNLVHDILLTSNESEDGLACQVDLSNSPAQSFFMEPSHQIEVSGPINTLKADSAPAEQRTTDSLCGRKFDRRVFIKNCFELEFRKALDCPGDTRKAGEVAIICPVGNRITRRSFPRPAMWTEWRRRPFDWVLIPSVNFPDS